MNENSPELEDINIRIQIVKNMLRPLLEEKKRIIGKTLKGLNCTCGVMVLGYDVDRIDNYFCKVHHPVSHGDIQE